MTEHAFSEEGNIIDIFNRKIFFGTVHVHDGRIGSIEERGPEKADSPYILPGFIDSHVHVESSMLIPSEFARLAVMHGTVATISDPHEIANVCGRAGVDFMINNAAQTNFKFHFGAPSCVPATTFETAGATLNAADVEALLESDDIYYLSEVMNFPGVLARDPELMEKINAAKKLGKPVDGHAPGLRGRDAESYIAAGISTDHECFTAQEAQEKLALGMKILIREGSAAKNFEALIPLLNEHWNNMMFCSDDKHPDSLADGHINQLCARAIEHGNDLFKVLQAACINPVLHYKMRNGLLRPGHPADFIIINNPREFGVLKTIVDGITVAQNGKTLLPSVAIEPINNFHCTKKQPPEFCVKADPNYPDISVIEASEGQLITGKQKQPATVMDGNVVADPERDILKIAVVNRYRDAKPAIAFIKNFGFKHGAIASSVAHDSHNIVAVGTHDDSICEAVNAIIEMQGGIAATNGSETKKLPLPVAGLMSTNDGFEVAKAYTEMNAFTKTLGCSMAAPFMTLSFMALPVIPHLKITDLGLFDVDSFSLCKEPY